MKYILVLSTLILILFSTASYAQAASTDTVVEENFDNDVSASSFGDPNDSGKIVSLPTSIRSYKLSIVILIFGVVLIICEMILVRSSKICAEDTIKFIIITIVIISTMFLITAGYSNNQIAPAIGLLGTITGYLLGKINPTPPRNEK